MNSKKRVGGKLGFGFGCSDLNWCMFFCFGVWGVDGIPRVTQQVKSKA